MGREETAAADGASAEELASAYEVLILKGISVPPNLDEAMREAHRSVHLRGLDPLRKTA
jgi:hypothetical protein